MFDTGNIYSISILNFNSEIGFFVKRPEFPSYISENFSRQITKFISKNYLSKHPSQRYFYVSMEHSISSRLRAKISLTGKLCIIIIFSSLLDIHYINLFHDGIKNILYALSGNKKIKMDDYKNEYLFLNKILLNTIYLISEGDKDLSLIKSIFKLRLMSILGFSPVIDKCTNCGKKENLLFFSLRDKGFKCLDCEKQDTSAIKISEATQNAIKYAILSPAKKIYSFNVNEESIKQLELVSKLYLEELL